jgi:hypothetical protein
MGSGKCENHEQSGDKAKKREGELRMLTGHFFAKLSHLIDIRDCGTNKENCYIYPIG